VRGIQLRFAIVHYNNISLTHLWLAAHALSAQFFQNRPATAKLLSVQAETRPWVIWCFRCVFSVCWISLIGWLPAVFAAGNAILRVPEQGFSKRQHRGRDFIHKESSSTTGLPQLTVPRPQSMFWKRQQG
jgi:hypothetical protein